jgi:GT2 family glycosyltransferase
MDDPRFQSAREVDYCSAVSLLVRQDLFRELGGFDRRYAPGYYEDVDICFGIRSLGQKVIYQPASRLIHFESISSAGIPGAMKEHMLPNKEKFRSKWRPILDSEHFRKSKRNVERAAFRLPPHQEV